MDKSRTKSADWYINFAQMNLTALKRDDRKKLIREAEQYLFPSVSKEDEYKREMPTIPTKDGIIIGSGSDMRSNWMYRLPPQGSEDYWKMIIDAQSTILAEIKISIMMNPPGWSTGLPGHGQFEYGVTKEGIMHFGARPMAENYRTFLWIKLYRALDGYPKASIVSCPGCNRIFFNPSLRRKKYCSEHCLWNVSARKWREENREKYREKQREIMKKKYEAKKKKDLGPNVKVGEKKPKN